MRAGLLSYESFKIQGADVVHKSGRQHQRHRYGEMRLELSAVAPHAGICPGGAG
jgi:hypothetical protein